MSTPIIKLLPVAVALALSGLAHASTVRELPSVVVKYGDLNLDSIEGVARLHARLNSAARKVCSQLDNRDPALRDQYEYCVSTSVNRGVHDVDNAKLTAFHRYGRKGVVASNS